MPGGSEAIEEGGRSTPAPSSVRLGALRHRDFRLFWIGQLISQVGTWMQSIAQAWLVLELTHSPLQLGVVSALQFTPILLLSPVGGAMSDRFAKRRLLLVSQTAMMLQALALALLTWSGYVRYWHVAVLAVIYGARIVGPAAAGLLVAGFGMTPAFFLNGVSFIAVLAALAAIRTEGAPDPAGRLGIVEGLLGALSYAGRTPAVAFTLGLMVVVSLLVLNFN